MASALRCVAWRFHKSFTTLINTGYSIKNAAWTGDSQDSGILSNPLSFVRSGYVYWSDACTYEHGSAGNYWSLRSYSTTASNYLYFSTTSLNPQSYNNRGLGFAVRCVVFASVLTSTLGVFFALAKIGTVEPSRSRAVGVGCPHPTQT